MADTDLVKLYSGRILELAANIPNVGHLDTPQGSAKRRSPLCGSTVTVDLDLDEQGRVARFAQDVKACALGQAAASVLGGVVIGLPRETIEAGRDQLYAMLKEGAPAPVSPFDGFEVLSPARDFKNRHASIMLAIEATLDAIRDAESRAA